jgi:hypothetical protein
MEVQIPIKKPSKNKRDDPKRGESQHAFPVKFIILAAALGFAVLAFIAWYFVNEHSARLKFLTESSLSFFVLIVIVVQAIIYRRQWDIMERQLKATESAADAAYIAQRAYIGVTDVKIMCSTFMPTFKAPIIVGERPTLYVTWHNGGGTPAEHFRAVPYLSFGEKPEYKGYMIDDDYGDMQFNFIPAGKVIEDAEYPQAAVGFPAFTKEMVEELNSGKKRLYAIIAAIYIDFTGRTRELHAEAIYNPFEGTFSDLYEYRTRNEQERQQADNPHETPRPAA